MNVANLPGNDQIKRHTASKSSLALVEDKFKQYIEFRSGNERSVNGQDKQALLKSFEQLNLTNAEARGIVAALAGNGTELNRLKVPNERKELLQLATTVAQAMRTDHRSYVLFGRKDKPTASFSTLYNSLNDIGKVASGSGCGRGLSGLFGATQYKVTIKSDLQKIAEDYDNGVKLSAGNMYFLGRCYEGGLNEIEKNPKKAAQLYKDAADLGHSQAMNTLAICHLDGIGVAKNQGAAVKLLERAAKLKNGEAIYNLARCYANGIGVAKDLAVAAKYINNLNWLLCNVENYPLGKERDDLINDSKRLFKKMITENKTNLPCINNILNQFKIKLSALTPEKLACRPECAISLEDLQELKETNGPDASDDVFLLVSLHNNSKSNGVHNATIRAELLIEYFSKGKVENPVNRGAVTFWNPEFQYKN